MGEESTEVIIAGKAEDKKETIYEIADLAYHVMVLMTEAGISLNDVRGAGLPPRDRPQGEAGEDGMITQNLHAHSRFDDGTATCEEMVRAAIAAGLKSFGISAHSPMPHEPWTVPKWRMGVFQQEMTQLKETYADRITVYRGVWTTSSPSRRLRALTM